MRMNMSVCGAGTHPFCRRLALITRLSALGSMEFISAASPTHLSSLRTVLARPDQATDNRMMELPNSLAVVYLIRSIPEIIGDCWRIPSIGPVGTLSGDQPGGSSGLFRDAISEIAPRQDVLVRWH